MKNQQELKKNNELLEEIPKPRSNYSASTPDSLTTACNVDLFLAGWFNALATHPTGLPPASWDS